MFGELKAAMHAAGIDPTHAVMLADSRVRRFHIAGDSPRSLNGWLQIFDNGDGSHGAVFGCHKRQIRETWHSGKPQRQLTASERREYAQRMAEQRRKQAEAEAQRHAQAATKAARILKQSRPADPLHPYLVRKGVQGHGLRQIDKALIVPVRSSAGQLVGLQFIQADNSKKFLAGTAVAGAYHAIGSKPDSVLLIAEGFATAATLNEATGHPVAIAFSAGNLKPVALALRAKYPKIQIIVCADADPVGRAAATEAAAAVNGTWIEPDFTEKVSVSHG